MCYEGQQFGDKFYVMGIGWFIVLDFLVIVGYNVFDWFGYGRGFGKVVDIKVYIGYYGCFNINFFIVQFCLGKVVVINVQWVVDCNNCYVDVVFVKFDKFFIGNFCFFMYKNIFESGDDMIGVVGYFVDKIFEDVDGCEEKGVFMWEQFISIIYVFDLVKNKGRGMFKYWILIFGGEFWIFFFFVIMFC